MVPAATTVPARQIRWVKQLIIIPILIASALHIMNTEPTKKNVSNRLTK